MPPLAFIVFKLFKENIKRKKKLLCFLVVSVTTMIFKYTFKEFRLDITRQAVDKKSCKH